MPGYEEYKAGAAGGTPLNVSRLNEPFHIQSVTYDQANDRLVWTIGRGRAWFGTTLYDQAAAVTVYQAAPATNQTYYAYLTTTGIVINTSANPAAGQIPLGGATVGATKATLTRIDRRPMLAGQTAAGVSYQGAAGLAARDVEAALDELDNEKIARGSSSQSVEQVSALLLATDTRSTTLTYTDGKLTQVTESDGATVVRTTTLNYTGDQLSSVVDAAGGRTITTTLGYNADGTLGSVTKAVV